MDDLCPFCGDEEASYRRAEPLMGIDADGVCDRCYDEATEEPPIPTYDEALGFACDLAATVRTNLDTARSLKR